MTDDSEESELKSRTRHRYFRWSENLVDRYEDQTNRSWRDDPEDFVIFVGGLRSSWTESMWRYTRSALTHFLQHHDAPVDVIEKLKGYGSGPCKDSDSSRKSMSSMLKRFPHQMVVRITKELDASLTYDDILEDWIMAGILTGLRPSEWEDAGLVEKDGSIYLKVKNRKQSRPSLDDEMNNFEYRWLNLDDMSDRDVSIIKSFTEAVNRYDEFDDLYDGCRYRLYSLTRTIWENRDRYPTLKSTRHQFAANIKSQEDERGDTLYLELAAMLGHQAEKTSRIYGYKRDGGQGGVNLHSDIKPSEKDLELTKQRFYSRPHELRNMYQGEAESPGASMA